MRIACWIPKATNTHPEYEILIPFPLQLWLQECASLLLLYVQCLCCSSIPTYSKPRTKRQMW